MTNTMQRLTKMLLNTDEKLKQMGTEPYGVRKLTAKEQRERIANMTPQEMTNLIKEHGIEEVNDWLNKYWRETNG